MIIRRSNLVEPMTQDERNEQKEIIKEAFKEWLQERFAEFGWFSFKALAIVAFGVIMALWLLLNGWHPSKVL